MVCGGLWWFVVDCGGLSFSHTQCECQVVNTVSTLTRHVSDSVSDTVTDRQRQTLRD